ncbi:TetR/AcrR family transcriptional regulator [Sphingomonas glaciei]|uniref:TetR/AcrR family transcriptional regulator n=1 Tax=Sphingomonas glaciei TaxID=2938948 RepID=A0ABY5MU34_9SPHN|nr:TetR/AcrR family transcriptional regulator [Sphingomonas glaciei]UUR07230.1 TetR/AcrR family transcriptional regulator [Sphingomonas glaciei]
MAKGGKVTAIGKGRTQGRRLAERPHETVPLTSSAKAPRTARGEQTRRKILDAARAEFGSRGFADTGITEITRTAKVALGTFYTYFHSKEEVFRALVQDMSEQVRLAVAPVLAEGRGTLEAEERALAAFLAFVGKHQQVYRIIDEAEFVDPAGFRAHYENTAARISERLADGAAAGVMQPPRDTLDAEVRAWAIMGMNVFLGLRFGVWGDEDAGKVAAAGNRLIRDGLGKG